MTTLTTIDEAITVSPIHVLAVRGNKNELRNHLTTNTNIDLNIVDPWGKTPIFYSILTDKFECLEILLRGGADVNLIDSSGRTPLHWAACKGHLHCCKLLFSYGIDRYRRDNRGRTAIHLAAKSPSVKTLSLLLKSLNIGRVDQQDDDKRTPLHSSAMVGNEDNVRLLIKNDANVGIPDVGGKTPLHLAASCPHPSAAKCAKLLLDCAPSVINWQDYEGRSPLHLAVADGCKETVKILISMEKCNINSMDNQFRTPLHWAAMLGLTEMVGILLEALADTSSTDGNGATPLHYAACYNFEEIVKIFLPHQNNVSACDLAGRNALLWASSRGSDDAIRVLAAVENAELQTIDKNGASSLHLAALNGGSTTVKLLLEMGISKEAKDFAGRTSLMYATETGHIDVVQELLRAGVCVDCVDDSGKTALHWAASSGHCYICQILTQKGTNPNEKDEFGRTPLHLCSFGDYPDCVSTLIQIGANPQQKDNEWMTPLHWSASRGHINIVKLLLKTKLRVNEIARFDQNCSTALDLAASSNHFETCKILIENGAISITLIREKAIIKLQAWIRRLQLRKHLNGKLHLVNKKSNESREFDVELSKEASLVSSCSESESDCDVANFTHLNSQGIKLKRKRFNLTRKKSVELVKSNCFDVVPQDEDEQKAWMCRKK